MVVQNIEYYEKGELLKKMINNTSLYCLRQNGTI
jgi:hypothetical protein